MKTTLHCFAKDLVRFRVLLLSWGLVLLLQIAFELLAPDHPVMMLFPIARFFFILVITPLITQGDPMQGSTAFWMTRPINWLDLLGSKLLLVLGAVIVPQILAQTIVFGLHHLSLAQAILGALQILFTDGTLTLFLMSVAALTNTFATYTITLAAGFIALNIFQLIFWFIANRSHPFAFVEWTPVSLDHSRQIVQDLVVLFTSAILLLILYQRRLPLLAGIAVALVGFLVATYSSQSWPMDFLHTKLTTSSTNLSPENFPVSFDPLLLEIKSAKNPTTGEVTAQTIKGQFSVVPRDRSVFAEVESAHLSWKVNGHTIKPLPFSGDLMLSKSHRPAVDPDVLKIALHIDHFASPVPTTNRGITLLTLTNEKDFGLLLNSGSLKGKLQVAVYRYISSSGLVLQKGRYIRCGESSVTLLDGNPRWQKEDHGDFRLRIAESTPDLLFERTSALNPVFSWIPLAPQTLYVLVNQEKSEAVFSKGRSDLFDFNFLTDLDLIKTKTIDLTFPNPGIDWLRNAVLVRVDRENIGELKVPFEDPNFSPKDAKPNVFDEL